MKCIVVNSMLHVCTQNASGMGCTCDEHAMYGLSCDLHGMCMGSCDMHVLYIVHDIHVHVMCVMYMLCITVYM